MSINKDMDENCKQEVQQLRVLVAELQAKLTHQVQCMQDQKTAFDGKVRENTTLLSEKEELVSQVEHLREQVREKEAEVDKVTKQLRTSEELVSKLRDGFQHRGNTIVSLEGTVRQLQHHHRRRSFSRFTKPKLSVSRSVSSPDVIVNSTVAGKYGFLQKRLSPPKSRECESQSDSQILSPLLEVLDSHPLDGDVDAVDGNSHHRGGGGATNGNSFSWHTVDDLLESAIATDISSLRWREGKKAPEKIAHGASVVCGNTAYFRPAGSHKVYMCTLISGKLHWSSLPDCKYHNFSLAVISDQITTIGGQTVTGDYSPTSTLLSLSVSGKKKQWIKIFPPMLTARCNTAAISSQRVVVVAGGYDRGRELDTVEVLNISTNQWSAASSLPQRFSNLVGTICGGNLYLAGGFQQQASKSVFTCSLSDLLVSESDSCELLLPLTDKAEEGGSKRETWRQVADLPVTHSTIATFGGDNLLAIGGLDESNVATSNIFQFDSVSDTWSELCVMKNKREMCFVAVLSEGKVMMVAGGFTRSGGKTDSVEVADVSNNSP